MTVLSPLVLIPAYKPGPALMGLLEDLRAAVIVIVVDDGSGPAYGDIFDALGRHKNVHLLAHIVNLGKGAALKTGLNYAACTFPSSKGVVTADADGQHTAADILKVAAVLFESPTSVVLGSRSFGGTVGATAPLRSRAGNEITRLVMRAVTGQKISDTQTGLRGIPMAFIGDLLRLPATGYDFELDMLVTCRAKRRRIIEVPIATIYLDGNRSSHFNPLRDSMRVYFVFLRFVAISLITTAIDNAIFIASLQLLPSLWMCQLTARVIAGTFNYFAGRRSVFRSDAQVWTTIPKYWLSVLISGSISFGLIQNVVSRTTIPVIPAKLAVETLMFFFSFAIQRDFVFSKSSREAQGEKGSA